jgi:hypothetical protein
MGARAELVSQRVPPAALQVGQLRGFGLDQREAREQIGADALEQVRLDRRPKVHLPREQRYDDEPERSREQLAADAQPHGSPSLPPTVDA